MRIEIQGTALFVAVFAVACASGNQGEYRPPIPAATAAASVAASDTAAPLYTRADIEFMDGMIAQLRSLFGELKALNDRDQEVRQAAGERSATSRTVRQLVGVHSPDYTSSPLLFLFTQCLF